MQVLSQFFKKQTFIKMFKGNKSILKFLSTDIKS